MTKNQLLTELKDINRRLYEILNVLDGKHKKECDMIDDALELLETTEKALDAKPTKSLR